jgi:hypothetical protein
VVFSLAGNRLSEVTSLPTTTVRGKGKSPTRMTGRS